ncbi:hypothetical protein C5S31_10895 [ANME-1 cluster archaeon GoMg2]|nr:hypothetical protein [ANME-1 cluster archaeon GoMg2]
MKQKEFLEAFKAEFWYQLIRKFGMSKGMSIFEKYLRRSLIPIYIFSLVFFTHYHYEILLISLTFVGCTWLSLIAMDAIKRIYHRRYELCKNPGGFRDFDEFSFREKISSYLISAVTLTAIFASGMVFAAFTRTGELNLNLFISMLSIPLVLAYNLSKNRQRE